MGPVTVTVMTKLHVQVATVVLAGPSAAARGEDGSFAAFIRQTDLHLAGAVLALIAIETVLVQADGGNIAGQAIKPVSPSTSDTVPSRPPGAVSAAAAQTMANQDAALASGQEHAGSRTSG